MRVFLRFLVMIVLGSLYVWSAEMPFSPGIYEQTLKTDKVKEFRYTLSLPANFASQDRVPLIVALHYGGDITPWYGERYLKVLVEPGLRDLGAIIIAPDCPSSKGWDNPKAESAVLELINFIKQNYKIDEGKTLLTGFSMGGVGAWYLVARNPMFFSAVVPVSSLPDSDAVEKLGDIPVLAIQGSGDEVFPVKKLEAAIQKLKLKGHPVQLKVIDGLTHYQTTSFVTPLQDSVPWIKQVWAGNIANVAP